MRYFPLLLLLGCPTSSDTSTTDSTPKDTDTGSGDTDTGDSAAENQAPSAPSVAINPSAPSDAATLRAVIVSDATDADGDAFTYRYEWLQNGTVAPGQTSDYLVSDFTFNGDVWTLNVYASDGTLEGAAGTASVTVGDLPPTAPTLHIDPAAPVSGDDLTLVFDTPAADPNGDTLLQTIEWYENGTHNNSWDNRTTIDGVYVDGGDTFRAVVTVTDGSSDPLVVEAYVTVPNSDPVITSVTVTPAVPDDSDELKCTVLATDPDGGKLASIYTWYRDGVEATDVGDSKTAAASFTTIGEQWECQVEVSDGIASVTLLSAAVEISAPTGYRLTSTVELTVTTDSTTGISSGTGTAEWDVYSSGTGASNDCDIYWALVATEDKTVCRGCTYSFDAAYTYDAATSSTVSGCADMSKDSTGTATFERRSLGFNASLDDPSYSISGYYYSTGLAMSVTGAGGYVYSYGAYTYGETYATTETTDAAGNPVISSYTTRYFYY